MKEELRALVKLATPLALARLGFILLGVVDTAVVGRLGEAELGAVGLGNALFFAIIMLGSGIVMGVEPLISQALGAGEHRHAREAMWQGMWLAGLLALPMVALGWALTLVLEPVGVASRTAVLASHYVWSRLPAAPLFMVSASMRGYLQGTGVTRPLVSSAIAANVLNLPLNWLLVFGDDGLVRLGLPAIGAPQLGVVGAGLTSSAVTALQLAVVALALMHMPCSEPFRRQPHGALLKKTIVVGIPIGLQRLAEVGIFTITGVLMGTIGTRAVASHQVAMTLVTTTFMIPLGISSAAMVRVGRAIGAGDRDGVKVAGQAAFILALSVMSLAALSMLLWPDWLAALLTNDPNVIAAAVPLIMVAAFFQISDGLQIVLNGALRGMGDTRATLYLNLAGHYVVGVPVGVGLAFFAGLGAPGLWWGLCGGLTAVALASFARFSVLAARGVERL